jgi:hypothetical protein
VREPRLDETEAGGATTVSLIDAKAATESLKAWRPEAVATRPASCPTRRVSSGGTCPQTLARRKQPAE